MSAPLVRARGLTKSFGTHPALRGVDFDVNQGEVAVLLGPSGSGKSTLLRTINHLEKPDTGFVEVNGEIIGYRHTGGRLRERSPREIAAQRSQIGMVFQQFNLFAHRTVAQNITEGPIAAGESRRSALDHASQLLERVGLAGREGSYPRQLSGGQQQRVAIARALAQRPKLILFDEPTSALDPELVGEVLSVIRDLAADGMTMVIVTHELGFAREVGDTVTFLEDGRTIESGPPEQVLLSPTNERTRSFVSAVL